MSGSAWLTGTSVLCLVLGLLFTVIGYSSPYWISQETGTSGTTGYSKFYQGLWQTCTETTTTNCDSLVKSASADWLKTCQALSTLGMVGTLITTVFMICYACTYRLSMCLKISSLIILLLSFVFCGVTIIVYRSEVFDAYASNATLNPDLDWSFFMMVIGCVFIALAIVFLIPTGPSRYGRKKYPYGFPFSQILSFGMAPYGSPEYGQVAGRGVYGRTTGRMPVGRGGDIYGDVGGRGGDYGAHYDREPYRRQGMGTYDPYSARGRF